MRDALRVEPDKVGPRHLLSAIGVFAVSNSGDFDRVADSVIEENPMIATAETETSSGRFKPLHVPVRLER